MHAIVHLVALLGGLEYAKCTVIPHYRNPGKVSLEIGTQRYNIPTNTTTQLSQVAAGIGYKELKEMNDQHGSCIERRRHLDQKPNWISGEVWIAINNIAISSTLPSNSTSLNTSCQELQLRNLEARTGSPFENAPLPDFDPFMDLENENTSVYNSVNDTLEYFELTTENAHASKVKEWYAQWTIYRRASPKWGPKGKGEWALFIAEMTGNPNFECSLGVACRNYMNLVDLVKRYPKNPELVRRIWFIENSMIDWHDFNSLTDIGYERAVLSITNQLPTLIETVVSRGGGAKDALCKMAHALINLGVQIAATAVGGMVGGVTAPYAQEGQSLFKLTQKFGQEVLPKTLTGEVGQPGSGMQMSFNFNQLWQGVLTGQLMGVEPWVQGGTALLPDWGSGIDGGKGMDPMCTPFEGDQTLSISSNIKKLQVAISDELNRLHKQLGKSYRDLFHGVVSNDGSTEREMSPTARMFMNQKWSGDDSVVSKVENPDQFQAEFEVMMALKAISTMASLNHQYQKCTYDTDAQAKCLKASQQTKPCTNPTGGRTVGCQRGIICPRPTNEPNIICKSAAWYYAIEHGHEIELPHLEAWENMFHNRDDDVFKWNRMKMLESTYDFYELYQNDFDSYYATFGVNPQNTTRGMAGLQIPVCFSMKANVANGRFPVGCGKDWRANETISFMNRLGMGEGSQVYKDRDAGFPNELFVSVIPDALDHHWPQSISPVSHYVTMCQLKIRHPDKTLDQVLPHNGIPGQMAGHIHATHMQPDKSCKHVMEATAGMTMDEADAWFCRTGAKTHGVFDREDYMTVSRPLLRTYDSHSTRCQKWNKRHRNT